MEITLQIDPDIEAYLERIVREYGHSPEYWLMELARNGREDLEDALLADKAMEEIRSGKARLYTTEEMEREIGLEDRVHG
jgi:RHH-type rel operon transcriptional repressor/antitoxin RelB